MDLAGFRTRAASVFTRLRTHVSRRRVIITLLIVFAVGTVGIASEALVRAHIVPPAARAPSALYTRPVAWGSGMQTPPVAIGTLNADLNETRDPISLDSVPKQLIDAVLAVEDQRFYYHGGFDVRRIVGALAANIKAGGVAEGGSTITQQLAKNLFLSHDRTPVRKIREAAMAAMLEIRYSKRQILEAYLNEVYFGQDGFRAIHGVGAASRFYFGKPVRNISLAEAALLAGMIRSPNRLAPTRHPDDARSRRNLVLGLMASQKRIDSRAADRARNARVATRGYPLTPIDARYFRDFVAASAKTDVPARGAAVYTTLDLTLQRSAERAITRGLARLGLREAQAALVAIDPQTGDVLAMVGGRDYGESQFNRAADARRQPGSAFKPIVALAALEADATHAPAFTLASVLEDAPLSVRTPQGEWQPANYDHGFRGQVTLREALEQSLNIPFARVGMEIGPARIASAGQRLGITSTLNQVPSLALGSSEVSLLELVRAYGVFATQGNLADTRTILARRDATGIERDEESAIVRRVADPAVTFLVTSGLQGVVQRGTGAGLNASRFAGEIAGKTGTSNDWRDAWFIAYTPTLAVGVWLGYDDSRSLKLSGGAAAVPIVGEFLSLSGAMRGDTFQVPYGVEIGYAPSDDWGSCGEREYFLRGTAPPSQDCYFRAFTDGALDTLNEFRRDVQRAIIERLRAGLNALRGHQR